MKEVTYKKYIADNGSSFDTKEECEIYEGTVAFSDEIGINISTFQYRKIVEYFKRNRIPLPRTKYTMTYPAEQQLTPEEHRADALAYEERLGKTSNPGIGSNR